MEFAFQDCFSSFDIPEASGGALHLTDKYSLRSSKVSCATRLQAVQYVLESDGRVRDDLSSQNCISMWDLGQHSIHGCYCLELTSPVCCSSLYKLDDPLCCRV